MSTPPVDAWRGTARASHYQRGRARGNVGRGRVAGGMSQRSAATVTGHRTDIAPRARSSASILGGRIRQQDRGESKRSSIWGRRGGDRDRDHDHYVARPGPSPSRNPNPSNRHRSHLPSHSRGRGSSETQCSSAHVHGIKLLILVSSVRRFPQTKLRFLTSDHVVT